MAYGNWDEVTQFYDGELGTSLLSMERWGMGVHIIGMRKLVPVLRGYPAFQNLIPFTSLTNLVMKVEGNSTQIRVWGDGNDQYRIYLSNPTIGEYGTTSDEVVVPFDAVIPTLEGYVKKLREEVLHSVEK